MEERELYTREQLLKAMIDRHSVRKYLDKPLPETQILLLRREIERYNKEADLHMQLITEDRKAFSGIMAKYGLFTGVTNYIALVGKKCPNLEEKLGYYGEKLVLLAQAMGLNTCWIGMKLISRKTTFEVGAGEKFCLIIALGYGENQGAEHKNKPLEKLMVAENAPDWFANGMEAVLLAPTAMNHQKFKFIYCGDNSNGKGIVDAKAIKAPYANIDLGIVKYHFELGAGAENFIWK